MNSSWCSRRKNLV